MQIVRSQMQSIEQASAFAKVRSFICAQSKKSPVVCVIVVRWWILGDVFALEKKRSRATQHIFY